jgi:predicted O-methyltransferase YrrM
MWIIRRATFEWRRARRRWADAVVEGGLRRLRRSFGDVAIPLAEWRTLWRRNERLAGRTLVRSVEALDLDRRGLPAVMRDGNRTDPLSPWALDAETARWLWTSLSADPPSVVVECGPGDSTLLLAGVGDGERRPVRVVSLEHDAAFAAATQARFAALAPRVTVLHAPLDAQGSYGIAPQSVRAALEGRAADLLFIDGPPDDCSRVLPMLAGVARPGARWMLDDAFDPAFFAAVEGWAAWPGIAVDGIVPVGKGLATGRVVDPAAAAAALG